MKRLSFILLLMLSCLATWAEQVKVTMNAVSTTMQLTPKDSTTPVETGEATNKVYEFSVAPGDYTLTGIATNGTTVNGSIDITVKPSNEVQEFTILTITAYVTNKTNGTAWTVDNGDYTIDLTVTSREGQVLNSVYGNSTTAGRNTFLALNGNTYYISFIPSAEHKAEGYAPLNKFATLTGNVTCTGAIPLSASYSVTVPSDAKFQLGTKTVHFADFKTVEPESVETIGGNTIYTYTLANAQQYNYRTWKTGGLTQAGYFTMSTDATKRPNLVFTEADYAAMNPHLINHNVQSNQGYETGDIFVNINPQGQLKLNVGDVFNAHAMRTWQLTDTQTNNYFMEPDFHYTIVGLDGQPSTGVIEIDEKEGSAWAKIKAVGNGTAIVLVTYDAIGVNYYSSATKNAYMGGEYWGTIWPENTGVYVVTVGQTESTATPNMKINEAYNEGAKKNAGEYVDAEHDVFYYLDSEAGAKYTFTPKGVASVEIAYPTIGAQTVTYSGFSTTGATQNADGSYTLLLKEGRQIVKLIDTGGNATYQVLTAKPCHREITNATRPGSTIFQPGDNVKIQYSGLRHPANKLAGIYNMSAYVTYNGIPNGTSLILGAGQYTFGSAAEAQAVTISILAETDVTETPQIAMTKGVIQVNGYGDPIGNHRIIDNIGGRSPNFTAIAHKTYFGLIPDVTIPLTAVKTFDIEIANSIEGADTKVYFDGTLLEADGEGNYSGTYGKYNVVATKDGYKCFRGTYTIGDDATGTQTFTVAMVASGAGDWDGKTMTEPSTDADGTYLISTGAELAWLANEVNTKSAAVRNARLTADIDLANFDWSPIGSSTSKYYQGTFSGDGHAVRGLYIDKSTTQYVGLFGYAKTATISGVEVYGTIVGKQYVGGVVGTANANVTIDRCANHADITGSATYVGGVVGQLGQATSKLTNSYNTGNVVGTTSCAGVVGGHNASSEIANIYNIGNVAGKTVAACVGGTTAKTKVTNAFSTKEYGITTSQTLVTESQMQSGEVAYKLGEAFGQEIGVEDYPVLGGMTVLHDEANDRYFNSATVSICSTGIATFCSTHNLDFTGLDVKAYAVTAQEDDCVKLAEVTEVPAGMGVILQGEAGTYQIPCCETATYTGVNYMKGVTTATSVPKTEDGCTNYILARKKSDDTVAFYPLNTDHTLAAGKAYLSLPGSAQIARIQIIIDDDATEIKNVGNDNVKSGDAFNLQGIRVNNSYKGIVIVNGKKILK